MDTRLRIILDYRPALRERTGVGEYVHELARALAAVARDRQTDRVVAFSSSWKDRVATTDLEGIDVVDARVPVRLLNFAWHRLEWPPIERFAGAVDVAHSAHPLLMPARGAAQAVTIHDLDFLEHPERTAGEIRRDYPVLTRAHARRADLVVVSSQSTAAQVSDLLEVPDERIVFCPAGAPAWTPRAAAPKQGYFLFVGTLEPRKNIGRLLDAYERLLSRNGDAPPLRLAGKLAATGSDWVARLEQPPLAGRVVHLGYVGPEDKRQLYEGALAVVIPSLHEGFGMPALEALTLGVPVIAARRGSLPEVLGDAAIFVEPDDAASIADGMQEVLANRPLARALSEAGPRRADAFSWIRSAETVRGAYERAVVRRRTTR